MENKYYTPIIEEFYIGFEFELNPWDWKNKKYLEKWIPKYLGIGSSLASMKDKYIRDEKVRVKYLDKEDIESLGFEFLEETPRSFNFKKNSYFLDLLKLFHNESFIPCILIHNGEVYEESEDWFFGEIKNKSELKVLLKQIKVI